MGNAKYIGRVGGLAVALGAGVAIATAPAVAWADETGTTGGTTTGTTTTADTTSDTTQDATTPVSPATPPSGAVPPSPKSSTGAPPKMEYRNTGGAHTSTHGSNGSTTDEKTSDSTTATESTTTADASLPDSGSDADLSVPGPASPKRSTRAAAAPTTATVEGSAAVSSPPSRPRGSAAPSPVATDASAHLGAPSATTLTASYSPQSTFVAGQDIPAAPISSAPAQTGAAGVVATVLAAVGLDPLATNKPGVPVDPPLSWAVFAFARRPAKEDTAGDGSDTLRIASEPQSSETFTATAMTATSVNSAPTASPTWNAPDDVNKGTVTGSVNGSDVDGNTLTYKVIGQPTGGTVTVDEQTGAFTYTPTEATRLAASQTTGLDTDSFTVSVSDGETSTPVTVTVPISSTQTQLNQPTTVGSNPNGVAVVGNYAYVANQGSNTVSVIDTRTGALVDTNTSTAAIDPITVGTAPTAVVASPDGSKVYVANSGSGTVTVINTSTNKVTNTIKVGSSPQGLAVSPDGTRLYVANTGSGTVSVVNTATNTLVDTNPSTTSVDSIRVGSSPTGLAVSPDGTRLYVANKSSGTVSVINTSTNKVTNTISVGSQPSTVAVSPDSKRVYVTNTGSNTLSVIDASNAANNTYTVTKNIALGTGTSPRSVAISRDGTLAYVANGNDTISVIDTKTNTVVRTVAIDPAAETGAHAIALSADGSRMFVTDAVDRKVRIVSVAHVNTAPSTSGPPTVDTVDAATGTVSGSLSLNPEVDGDKLTFTTASGPASGTVTYDAATGTYTYTPTAAAREQAAQTAGDDYDHFTVNVSDGQAVTAVAVTVPISPKAATQPPASSTAVTVVGDPVAVAVTGPTDAYPDAPKRAYVVSVDPATYRNTVSVVDTDPTSSTYNQVIDTIPIDGTQAKSVAASADGTRVYVSSYDTVSVIDTDPQSLTYNQVIDTIYVPDVCGTDGCLGGTVGVTDVAVSPDGKRVYAVRGYTTDSSPFSTVSVIDTDPTSPTYHQVILTEYTYQLNDIEVTPDGTRIYGGQGDYRTVNVYDAATLQVVDRFSVTGPPGWPVVNSIAISPDGTRAYAVVQPDVWDTNAVTVSVIDTDPTSATYNQEIATITVPEGARDVAVSPDGSLLYVTQADGRTVTVIDTATRQVIGTITTDQNSTANYQQRSIAVGSDGTVYVTDAGDDALYVTSFKNTNM